MIAWILSILGLGGAGAVAAYFLAGPAAMLAFGRGALGFLAKIPWQVYVIAALAALLAFLTISRGHWIDRARGDEAQLAAICQAARIADHNPKLDCSKSAAQIMLLGQALEATTAAIGRQNEAIQRLAAATAREQAAAAQARHSAERPARDAEATAARFDAEARSAAAQRAPGAICAPSKALQEQWK